MICRFCSSSNRQGFRLYADLKEALDFHSTAKEVPVDTRVHASHLPKFVHKMEVADGHRLRLMYKSLTALTFSGGKYV